MKNQRGLGALLFLVGLVSHSYGVLWTIPFTGFGLLLFIEAVAEIAQEAK